MEVNYSLLLDTPGELREYFSNTQVSRKPNSLEQRVVNSVSEIFCNFLETINSVDQTVGSLTNREEAQRLHMNAAIELIGDVSTEIKKQVNDDVSDYLWANTVKLGFCAIEAVPKLTGYLISEETIDQIMNAERKGIDRDALIKFLVGYYLPQSIKDHSSEVEFRFKDIKEDKRDELLGKVTILLEESENQTEVAKKINEEMEKELHLFTKQIAKSLLEQAH